MRFITIKKGVKRPLVGEWQSFLRGLNLYWGKIDDDFGNITHNATISFQKLYGLKGDGIVGKKTWTKAVELGIDITEIEKNDWYPPKPNFKPIIGNKKRMDIFGEFEYTPAPTSRNPEKIIVDGKWKKEHIVKVKLPALKEATNGKYSGMYWHKLVADQLESFFNEIHKKGLHKQIITQGLTTPVLFVVVEKLFPIIHGVQHLT
jgi:hypothetical protein